MRARRHYLAIESGYFVERFRCIPGNNFDDCFQAMLLVSRINALGRIANIKATLDVFWSFGLPKAVPTLALISGRKFLQYNQDKPWIQKSL